MTTITTNQETFIIDAKVREAHRDRMEVLERVKGLLLLPNIGMATTQQVADFYEVGLTAITAIYQRHEDELLSDGMETVTGRNLKERLVMCKMSPTKIENKPGHFVVKTSEGQVKLAHRSNRLFPRRAILRIGMLLRDSEVAKEVRTQLLNIEEKVVDEVKTMDINEEQRLQIAVGQAFSSGDMVALAKAVTELNEFKSHHLILTNKALAN